MTLAKRMLGPGGFAISNATTAAVALFIVPLLARILTPGDLETWILSESVLLVCGQFLTLGLGYGAVNEICKEGRDPKDIYAAHSTLLRLAALMVLALALPIYLAFGISWALVALNGAVELYSSYLSYFSRAVRDIVKYFAVSVTRLVLPFSAASVVWAGYVDLHPSLTLPFLLVTRFAGGTLVVLWIVKSISKTDSGSRHGSREDVKNALRFGVPLVLAGGVTYLQDLMIRATLGLDKSNPTLIQYYVHLKVAAIVSNLIVVPFGLWWASERFRLMARGAPAFEKEVSVVAWSTVTAFGLSAGLLYSLLSIAVNFFNPAISASGVLYMLILVPMFLQVLSSITNAGLMQAGQTGKVALVQGFSSALVIALAIPVFHVCGIRGVLALLCFGALVSFSSQFYLSTKKYPVRYPILSSLLLLAAGFAIGQYGAEWGRWTVKSLLDYKFSL